MGPEINLVEQNGFLMIRLKYDFLFYQIKYKGFNVNANHLEPERIKALCRISEVSEITKRCIWNAFKWIRANSFVGNLNRKLGVSD